MEPFDSSMTLSRPYLIRAIYQWIVDNNYTPYMLVDCSDYLINIPQEYIRNNEVVLNVGLSACGNLLLGDEVVSFSARFNGLEREVDVPISSILAIYSKENNQGLSFSNELLLKDYKHKLVNKEESNTPSKKEAKKKGPTLTIVKP